MLTKRVLENQLDVDEIIAEGSEEADVELIDPDEFQEQAPHLVFLIPGIRTQGMWIQDAIDEQFTSSGLEIIFKPVRGDGRSSTGRLKTTHLVTRLHLERFRNSFVQQIKEGLAKHPSASISIFAHSMGSSLLAEKIEEISQEAKKSNREIENIVFLGSVCHRRHSRKVGAACKRFINDVGVRDMWPFRASVVRPGKYSDVGLWGFRDIYPYCERYFYNDHKSCTSTQHLKEKLVPLLDETLPLPQGIKGARPARPEHHYEYFRRIMSGALVVALLVALASSIWLGLSGSALLFAFFLSVWIGVLLLFE